LAKDVDIDKPIPSKGYVAVVEVLSMVYKLKKKVGWAEGIEEGV